MRLPSSSGDDASLMRRLDRAAGQLNAFLVIVAIGLALLDLTCFSAITVEQAVATGHPGMASSIADGGSRSGP